MATLNAGLNASAGVLLTVGYFAIRRRRVRLHRTCMIAAFVTSAVFLASYVVYHTVRQMQHGVGHTVFRGTGATAAAYYAILASHVVLAAAVPVMAIMLLRRAFRGDFAAHRRLARWAWPIWMYVSVTGVVIYVMLYWLPVACCVARCASVAACAKNGAAAHLRDASGSPGVFTPAVRR